MYYVVSNKVESSREDLGGKPRLTESSGDAAAAGADGRDLQSSVEAL